MDDIDNQQDEYDIQSLRKNLNIDAAATKIEGLHTKYCGIHNRLKVLDTEYNAKYDKQFKIKITEIKSYIRNLKAKRDEIFSKDDQSKENAEKNKKKKFNHLKESFSSCTEEL